MQTLVPERVINRTCDTKQKTLLYVHVGETIPVPAQAHAYINIVAMKLPNQYNIEIADLLSSISLLGSAFPDFDSVNMFAPGWCATSVPDMPCVPKSDTTKVLGTPYYRAPEVI